MKKLLIAISILTVSALALSACGSDEESTTTTTKAEKASGNIVVYTGRNLELIQPLVDDFEKDSGITVELRDGDSGALASQIVTEGKESKADVFFSQDAGALGLLSERELLEKLPKEITRPVDSRFKSRKNEWVGTSGRARVLVYNTDKVKNPPSSLDELVDPKYKGKVAFAPSNASFQSFVTALRVLEGEKAAKEWLEKFSANEPKVYEKNSAIVEAVNKGEIEMGLVNHYYRYELANELGEDNMKAKNFYFEDGTAVSLVNAAGAAILKTSSNKAAAEEFIKYLISKKGQQYFVTETFEYPVTREAKSFKEIPTLDELKAPDIDLSDLKSLDETLALLDEVGLITK